MIYCTEIGTWHTRGQGKMLIAAEGSVAVGGQFMAVGVVFRSLASSFRMPRHMFCRR
jgi:hypothetical protein